MRDRVSLSEEDREILREIAELLDNLIQEALGEGFDGDPRVTRAAYLSGRITGLAGRTA